MTNDSVENHRYILQDRDGDYVEKVESTGRETAKLFFTFTKDQEKAKVFTYDDLWWRLATTAIGGHFTAGFAGGKAVRVY